MSIPLPDVNLLVALLDPAHVDHDAAHAWFSNARSHAWATCPITVNGCVRVLSNPAYPSGRSSPFDIALRLREVCAGSAHQFWPDDVSLLDTRLVQLQKIRGHRQLTDVYLVALAVRHEGHLVTMDRSIPWRAVLGATEHHVLVLGDERAQYTQ